MELTRKLLDSSAVTLADQRQVTVICSTGDADRMGDIIVQNGIDLTAYKKNPIVLWGHSADVPIARAIEIDIKNGKLQATVQFPPEGDDEDSDWVYGKIKAGIVNATSVGFIPRDYEPIDSKQPWSGFKFTKSELLEFSFVSVPANAGCLIVGRSLLNAMDVPMLPSEAKSSGHKVEPEEVSIPRNILEETFRRAKTPLTTRQKYLGKSQSPEWKVGASLDLPFDDTVGWDGAAAAKRMLDDAGFDGDTPNLAKAARGFLIFDAENPTARSSYKMPFADIFGGELRAVRSGISCAKDNKAPDALVDEVKAVIDGYELKSAEPSHSSVEKSGRKISSANQTLLQTAMDHHESATKCIKDVLASNVTDDDSSDEDDGNQMVVLSQEPIDPRAQRLAEARALRASAKI